MSKTYRLGVIGFAHMHVNTLLDYFAALPNVEWVACADTVPIVPTRSDARNTRRANLRRAHEHTGIPKIYRDYQDMLERERFDIVIFCPENARHAEVAEAIAAKGAHMLTEKPMAADLSGALRMVRAARANGVSLLVNWPTTWQPAIRKMKALLDEGVIGEILEVKWRNGGSMGPLPGEEITNEQRGAEWWHQSAPGGGALLDYCCYGACLARWFIGEPAVAALGLKANLTSHYGDAEDNAIITVRFPKALAILEGSWTTWNVGLPTGPIVYGAKGTLVVSRKLEDGQSMPVVEIYTSRSYSLIPPDEIVEGDPLPEGRTNIAEEFIHHLETGEPPHPTLEMGQNLESMAILDAGIRSAASGKLELVNDAIWCIG